MAIGTFAPSWAVQGNILWMPDPMAVTRRFHKLFGRNMSEKAKQMLNSIEVTRYSGDSRGEGPGICSHPFIVISRSNSEPDVVLVAMMTTFGSLGLEAKFPESARFSNHQARDAHIPLEPAEVHPRGHFPLSLRDGVCLKKPSWVRTDRVWEVPLGIFGLWDAGKEVCPDGDIRLTENSIRELLGQTVHCMPWVTKDQVIHWKQRLQEFPERFADQPPKRIIRNGIRQDTFASGLQQICDLRLNAERHIIPLDLPKELLRRNSVVPPRQHPNQKFTQNPMNTAVSETQIGFLNSSPRRLSTISNDSGYWSRDEQNPTTEIFGSAPKKWACSVLRLKRISMY